MVLLHCCCAPCANRCIDALQAEGHQLTAYWYNPNIHPFTEFRARRNTLREYLTEIGVPLLEEPGYGLRPFLREVGEDFENRCATCYRIRLFQTAKAAAEHGFSAFTTTLLISPYQNHELILQTGAEAAEEYGVTFLSRDFRPLFRDGQTFAREHGFYMQKYCGCIFSEEERYIKPKKILR